ncbi:low temperature requirement protein A [Micromonospora sp. STR1s_5]|nr:low temperature requirement protein A [Micromonospora sp. STR1s_5]
MSMTTDGGVAAASPPDPSLERPAFLELFFDLVYVFALVTLATVLADDLTWTGVAGTLVLLLGFTMIWALTVWTADSVDLTRPAGQGQFIWVAAASLLLAALAATRTAIAGCSSRPRTWSSTSVPRPTTSWSSRTGGRRGAASGS